MYFTNHIYTIPEQIAGQIKEALLRGELHLGDRLPSENELAKLFGVSRSTIRDALHLLKTEEILQTRNGCLGGHFINPKVPSQMIESLEVYTFSQLNISQLSRAHLFETRSIIDVPVAGLASLHRSDEDLASLEMLLLRIKDLSLSERSSYPFLQAAIAFQRILVQASQNPLLIKTHAVSTPLLEIHFLHVLLSPCQQQTVFEHLKIIFSAVKNKDPAHAKKGMKDYLRLLQKITPIE